MNLTNILEKPHAIGERCKGCEEADYRHPTATCSDFQSKMLAIVREADQHLQFEVAVLNYISENLETFSEAEISPKGLLAHFNFKIPLTQEFSLIEYGKEIREWVKTRLPTKSSSTLGKFLIKKGLIQPHELYFNIHPPHSA
ncbi:MAG TPA: hypothetical protein VFA52_00570 [Candidatus Paceibacterota bacterium]|nr:hypothetical protein [Candidatus Paceibacterota bacterium]